MSVETMPIPFMCFSCGKSVNVPDSYAGKKIKCSCGAIEVVDAVAAAPAVKKTKKKSARGGQAAGKPLTKKQKEERALEKSLGKDWKKKSEQQQHRIGGESQHWAFDALDVLRQGPVQAFWGFVMGSIMLCMGIHMFTWMPRIGMIKRLPQFFTLFGVFTCIAGFVLLVMGLVNKEKRSQHSNLVIGGIIAGTILVLCILAGTSVWFYNYMQEDVYYDDFDNFDDIEVIEFE